MVEVHCSNFNTKYKIHSTLSCLYLSWKSYFKILHYNFKTVINQTKRVYMTRNLLSRLLYFKNKCLGRMF